MTERVAPAVTAVPRSEEATPKRDAGGKQRAVRRNDEGEPPNDAAGEGGTQGLLPPVESPVESPVPVPTLPEATLPPLPVEPPSLPPIPPPPDL
jgi:hypothetical protein